MEGRSTPVLLELSRNRIDFDNTRLEEQLSAPLEAPPPLISPSTLLRLPFEIRLHIYSYCIPRKYVIHVSYPRFHIGWPYEEEDYTINFGDALDFEDDISDLKGPQGVEDKVVNLEANGMSSGSYSLDKEWDHSNKNSIFVISKQISKEALDILYGENIFKLHLHGEGEYFLKKNFTEENRQRMRNLLLIAQPKGASYELEKMPDYSLWSSVLPTLKVLRLVAKQPVKAFSYDDAPSLEQEVDRWVKWITPFLQCFGQYLSRETNVQVDIGGRAETRGLVEECLPHGYREIRCRHIGDLIFKRGRFSRDSGYWDGVCSFNPCDAEDCWDSD